MHRAKDLLFPELKVVFESCYRAARRKFPEGLVPMIAVSSILMLRFLMPQFALSYASSSRLGQKFLTAFVFGKPPEEEVEEQTFRKIAEFLLDISSVDKTCESCENIEKRECNLCSLLQFTADNLTMVMSALERAENDDHALVWSILELLENVVSAPEDETRDILRRMDSYSFCQEQVP
jgi:hypothetical protein